MQNIHDKDVYGVVKKRFNFKHKFWHSASFLKPDKILDNNARSMMPTLLAFVETVPRIYKGNIQDLDNEWRNLDTISIPGELKAEMCIIDFYRKLGDIKENDVHQFKNLSKFALQIVALPITNTDADCSQNLT